MTLADLLAQLPNEALVPVSWVRARLAEEGKEPAQGAPVGDLSCADVGKMLDRTPGCIRGWCARGEIQGAYRLNAREWRIPPLSLRQYLDRAAKPKQVDPGPVDLGSWRRQGRS